MLEHKIHINFERIWIFAVVIFIVSNLKYLPSQNILMTTLFAKIFEFHTKYYNISLYIRPAIRSLIARILYTGIPFSIHLEICSFSCHKHKYTLAYSTIIDAHLWWLWVLLVVHWWHLMYLYIPLSTFGYLSLSVSRFTIITFSHRINYEHCSSYMHKHTQKCRLDVTRLIF